MITFLEAGETRLRLDIDTLTGWCRICLIRDGETIPVGADTVSIVKERLGRGVSESLEGVAAGEIAGLEVIWIGSLSEHHSTIYGCDAGDVRVLFIQDADGDLAARIELDQAARRRWHGDIEALPVPNRN